MRTLPLSIVVSVALTLACCAEREPISGRQAAANTDWSKATVVSAGMHEFHYQPETLEMTAGQPYDLRIHNSGTVDHTFTAAELFAASELRDDVVSEQLKQKGGVLEVGAGDTVDVYLVPRRGTYTVECSVPLHASVFGMRGTVTVVAATNSTLFEKSGAPTHSPDLVREVQRLLTEQGFDAGPIDGVFGPRTRSAIKEYQEYKKLPSNGEITDDTIFALRNDTSRIVEDILQERIFDDGHSDDIRADPSTRQLLSKHPHEDSDQHYDMTSYYGSIWCADVAASQYPYYIFIDKYDDNNSYMSFYSQDMDYGKLGILPNQSGSTSSGSLISLHFSRITSLSEKGLWYDDLNDGDKEISFLVTGDKLELVMRDGSRMQFTRCN